MNDQLHTLNFAFSGLSPFHIIKYRSNFIREEPREKCQTE